MITDEGNQLIAEFVGWKLVYDIRLNSFNNQNYEYLELISPDGFCMSSMSSTMWGTKEETYARALRQNLTDCGRMGAFHKDWHKLMPAIRKFRSLNNNTEHFYKICERIDEAIINEYLPLNPFYALVAGIRWYNKQKNDNIN